jgi:uncharacterized protein YraI
MKKLLRLAILIAFLLSACVESSTNTNAPGPSVVPTRISTKIATVTATTPTTIPLNLRGCVNYESIRIRRGPGTQYETIGGLVSGTCLSILGRNEDSSWVYMVSEDNKTGWVAAWLLTIEGDVAQVSVKSVIAPLPTYTVVVAVPPAKQKTPKPQNSTSTGSQESSNQNTSSQDNTSGASAICVDGTLSYSAHRRGTCSYHGGVAQWLKNLPP